MSWGPLSFVKSFFGIKKNLVVGNFLVRQAYYIIMFSNIIIIIIIILKIRK